MDDSVSSGRRTKFLVPLDTEQLTILNAIAYGTKWNTKRRLRFAPGETISVDICILSKFQIPRLDTFKDTRIKLFIAQ